MILDIGGGSTECIYFQNNQPLQYWSRPCGAMALIQETRPSDPLKTEEIIKIEKRLEDYWGAALDFMYPAPPQLICGSSGFFDTLYEMYFRALYPDQVYQAPLHWEISVSALIPWLEKLERLSREERLKIPGMPAFRAEMAGVSARLITFFIKKFSPERIFGTRFALKEGYMIHCLMQNPKP